VPRSSGRTGQQEQPPGPATARREAIATDGRGSAAALREAIMTEGRGNASYFFPFGGATTPEGARCDVKACAAAYDSFRASDCTYQSYGGGRKLCSIAGAGRSSIAQVPSNSSCNVDVCSRRYRSFDVTDCSYQPYGGGARRFCGDDR
jgi:hypothetical protein